MDELKKLVDEFSRFARLPQLSLAPQDFNALVQETLLLYQEAQPRITLEFQPDPELPSLGADEAGAPQFDGQRPGRHCRQRQDQHFS